MNQTESIAFLESAWSESNGILYKARAGHFNASEGESFINTLTSIKVEKDELLKPRFVSLLWYVPQFLTWQKIRVEKKSKITAEYNQFCDLALNEIQNILGIP